jgi:hypothetical protein
MSTATCPAPTTGALAALFDLTPEQVRARLAELEAERKALVPILRALVARERALARRQEAINASR